MRTRSSFPLAAASVFLALAACADADSGQGADDAVVGDDRDLSMRPRRDFAVPDDAEPEDADVAQDLARRADAAKAQDLATAPDLATIDAAVPSDLSVAA